MSFYRLGENRGRPARPVKMEMRVGLAGAFRAGKREENRPENGDLRCIVVIIQAILHQGANRAVFVPVEIVVMVLRDRKQSRNQQDDDYCPRYFHHELLVRHFCVADDGVGIVPVFCHFKIAGDFDFRSFVRKFVWELAFFGGFEG